MESSERQHHPMRSSAGGCGADGRSPALAFVTVDVDLLRKNERDLAADELSEEEAEAFGYC